MMAKARLYPHRRLPPDAVSWQDWWIERDGGRAVLPPLLTAWDYATSETIGISAAVDFEAVLAGSGLDTLADLEVLALADCAATQQRFAATAGLSACQGEIVEARITLPRGQLAGSVRLSAHVVLARTKAPRGDRAAFLRGSLLHSSDPLTVHLEGDASRFPTEPVSFSEIGLGKAPWTVLAVHHDLASSFMGSVRLLINTDHPAGKQLLATPNAHIGQLLKTDIVRLLVASTARSASESAPPSELEEGSIGQVLDTMSRFFLGRSLRMAAQLYLEDPAEFDRVLHDRLDPLAGLAK
jgi:hypothetical protein